jgi:hypothetical protein
MAQAPQGVGARKQEPRRANDIFRKAAAFVFTGGAREEVWAQIADSIPAYTLKNPTSPASFNRISPADIV